MKRSNKHLLKEDSLIGFDEAVTGKEVIKRARRHTSDPKIQATLVSNQLKSRIKKDIASIEEEIEELYSYCSNEKHGKRTRKQTFIERLLLNLLDIMAEYEYRHKQQVRNILTLLYQLYPNAPETIHGEVFYFEYTHCMYSLAREKDSEKKQFYKKLHYMIDMVACWSPPNIQLLDHNNARCPTYLDFPMTHDLQRLRVRDYTLLINSLYLYGLRDMDLMLYLLRCGTSFPACLPFQLGWNPAGKGNIAQIIRYFCRTKRWIHLHLLPDDGPEIPYNIHLQAPEGVTLSDILIVRESSKSLVPVDRYKEPSKLLHQCRLTIRKELQKAEQLPYGPQELPLPASLRNYVDLLED